MNNTKRGRPTKESSKQLSVTVQIRITKRTDLLWRAYLKKNRLTAAKAIRSYIDDSIQDISKEDLLNIVDK